MTGTDRRTSSLAIVSLVAGLLGWTLAPWLGSIIAIITGHMLAPRSAAIPPAWKATALPSLASFSAGEWW